MSRPTDPKRGNLENWTKEIILQLPRRTLTPNIVRGNPGRISRFWEELKRRKVLSSLAIYCGSAFVILEASSIIFPRWNFPDWTIDLVLWLLILGAVVNLFIAWFFDMTPRGLEKTKPVEEEEEVKRKDAGSRGWKAATYLSLVIIVALIVYNVITGGEKVLAGDIKSLVVLPFDNFTGDDQLDYFVSGMHASLIGDMGKLGGWNVKSRTSSNAFKDKNMTIPEIASALGVDAALETAVMCLGDTICIQIRLLRTTGEEDQLFESEYREEKSQILNLYNKVTRKIAQEVKLELSPGEEDVLNETRSVNKDAYDAYLMGLFYWDKLSQESLEKALEYFNQAIETDPAWAPPYAGIAQVWLGMAQMGFTTPETAFPVVMENITRSTELDPDYAYSHYMQAVVGVWVEWNWEKGKEEFLTALALNPNDAMAHIYYAHLLVCLQRTDEAVVQGQTAVDLDPLNPLVLALNGVVLACADQGEKALEHIKKAASIDPSSFFAHHVMEFASYEVGDVDAYIKAMRFLFPFEEEELQSIELTAKQEGIKAAYEEVVARLEPLMSSMFLVPVHMAMRYVRIQQYDKAMDQLELGFRVHDQNMPYIATGFTNLVPLYSDPRFITLMDQLKLPMPDRSP
jgi:adenylate cyclase